MVMAMVDIMTSMAIAQALKFSAMSGLRLGYNLIC